MSRLPDNHDINHLKGALRQCKKFGLAVDGGANRGVWTKIFSEMFETVHAFEPVTELFNQIPDFDNVFKHNVGLGDEGGDFLMSPGPHNEGQWHFSHDKPGKVTGKVVRLDDLGLSPDFLKLDVEGYELFALKGAEETIKRSKPVIFLELNGLSERYGHVDEDVRAYIYDFGYKQVGHWNKDYLFSL